MPSRHLPKADDVPKQRERVINYEDDDSGFIHIKSDINQESEQNDGDMAWGAAAVAEDQNDTLD